MGRAGLFALNAKITEITRRNAEAHFAVVMRLAEAKDLHQALELQSQHMKQRMDVFAKQLEEMRDPDRADHPGGQSGTRRRFELAVLRSGQCRTE